MTEPLPSDFGLTGSLETELRRKADYESRVLKRLHAGIFVGATALGLVIQTLRGGINTAVMIQAIGFGIGVSLFSGYVSVPIIEGHTKRKFARVFEFKAALFEYTEWNRRRSELYWLELTPKEFELAVCELFEKIGIRCTHTGKAGDEGIDLLTRGQVAIQCKATRSAIGPGPVRELRGSVRRVYGILVSRGGFTRGAEESANPDIALVDLNDLIELNEGRENACSRLLDIEAKALRLHDAPRRS